MENLNPQPGVMPPDVIAPQEQTPAAANGLYDHSAYQTGVTYHEWTPDPQKPEQVIKLWLCLKVLKPSDQTAIQSRVNQLDLDSKNLDRLKQQLQHLKPDSRVERNENTIRGLSQDDFKDEKDPEAAYLDRKEKLQGQVDQWMREYDERHAQIEAQIKELLARPTFFQLLRSELFAKVVHDHTIGVRVRGSLVKADFKSADPDNELTDEFALGLQEFIYDCIKKESRAGKKKSR